MMKKRNVELYDFIVKTYSGTTFSEKFYNCVNNNESTVVCKHCGDMPTKFLDFKRGYSDYCSKKCQARSPSRREKIKETCLKKYGVEHFSQTKDYKQKFKDTCLAKYGVNNPGQIHSLKETRSRNKQKTFFEQLVKSVESYAIPLFDFEDYQAVRKHMPWLCLKCKTEFNSHVFNKVPQCPQCFPTAQYGGQSTIEKEIVEFIKTIFHDELIENCRDIISPKELDIYIPSRKLAIEVHGVYWHSDQRQPDKFYHQQKQMTCERKGIKLISLLDYEWRNNQAACKHIIMHNLGVSTKKIHARECKIHKIDVKLAREFSEQYHIMGFQPASLHLGMFRNGEIVAYMSLSKDRFSKTDDKEIVRFCSSATVRGGLSKFVSWIKKHYNNCRIISYVDLRWGNGDGYEKVGFKLVKRSNPGYWYFYDNRMYHRLSFTKKKLVARGFSAGKTEFEIMDEIGALRFWDCGEKLYEY